MTSMIDDLANRYVKFDETKLSRDAFQKLRAELNETDEAIESGLETIRKKLADVDFDPCLEKDFLLRFLRVCKFDVEKTIARIHKYYRLIIDNPKYFRETLSRAIEISKTFRQMKFGPYRMKDNSLLVFYEYGKFDISKVSFQEMFLLTTMVENHMLQNPITQMVGVTSVTDFSGLSAQSLLAHTPSNAKMFLEFISKTLPIRGNKAMHVVNTPTLFFIFYQFAFRFLSKKMQNRLFIYRNEEDFKSLHSKIPRELLPVKYGGDLPNSALIDPLDNMELVEQQYRNCFPVD